MKALQMLQIEVSVTALDGPNFNAHGWLLGGQAQDNGMWIKLVSTAIAMVEHYVIQHPRA